MDCICICSLFNDAISWWNVVCTNDTHLNGQKSQSYVQEIVDIFATSCKDKRKATFPAPSAEKIT